MQLHQTISIQNCSISILNVVRYSCTYLVRKLLFVLLLLSSALLNAQNANLLVGTYTQNGSKGIYLYYLDTATGTLIEKGHTDAVSNPSFLAISKDKQFVYAVNENEIGSISSFALNLEKNKLQLLNKVETKGAHPCHISISPDEKNIFVANYSGGSLTSFHRFADGRLSNAQQFIQNEGASIHPTRQTKAHVHGSFFSPDGKWLLVNDLGMDKTLLFNYQTAIHPPLKQSAMKDINANPGAGPRHLSFSKNGQRVYVLEELSGSISVYDFKKGVLKLLQRDFTHPADFKDNPGSADIHISPDGKFLYASNRGTENNIVQYQIDQQGLLKIGTKKYTPSGGMMPRNFTMSADGKWLLVANQASNNIVVFKRNLTTGNLTKMPGTASVPMPVCLVVF
jgi:6-phosphogluconolactonase